MPGMHVGGSFHDTFHPTGVQPPEVRPPSGSRRGESPDVAGSPQAAASHGVLRLRGGGNTHGSGEKGGDREHLVPGRAGSSSERMYHGTQSGSETQRARNEAKRYELQARLDQARSARDAARAGRDRAVADLEGIAGTIKGLVADKERSGSDRVRLKDIQRQLDAAHADYWRKTSEVSNRDEELRKSDRKCQGFERKLDELKWT